MKKLLLLTLAIVLFIACQNQPQRYFEESAEIETLKSGIKAYEAQDWDTWKTNYADTAKIYHNTLKGISPNENIEGQQGFVSNFSSYGFQEKGQFVEMVLDKDGETWVNYWGVWKGKFKANQKELSIPVHLTSQFINGKIVQEYAYYVMSSFMASQIEIEAQKMDDEAEAEFIE